MSSWTRSPCHPSACPVLSVSLTESFLSFKKSLKYNYFWNKYLKDRDHILFHFEFLAILLCTTNTQQLFTDWLNDYMENEFPTLQNDLLVILLGARKMLNLCFSINCKQGYLNILFPKNILKVNQANTCLNGSILTIHTCVSLSYFSLHLTLRRPFIWLPISSACGSGWHTAAPVTSAATVAAIGLLLTVICY